MDKKDLKLFLAGLALTGLAAGAGLTAAEQAKAAGG